MKIQTLALVLCISVVILSCTSKSDDPSRMQYPISKKTDSTDIYFGTSVADPYRWLEDDRSIATTDWIKAENDVTFGYLEKIPYHQVIRDRMEKIYDYERLSAPFIEGEFKYFYKNDGLQNQSVLYRKKNYEDQPEVFLDPNTFSTEGTTSLSAISFTHDGSLAAYLISEGGSDWRKAIVMRTADKTIVEDTLRDLKFSGLAWKGNEGFYYSLYDKPDGSELSAKTQFHKLFYHKVGTPQYDDLFIMGGEQTPRRYIGASVTEDERFLVVTAAKSTSGNEFYVQDLHDPHGALINIVSGFDNDHSVIDNAGSRLLVLTNRNAPNGRIVSIDPQNPSPNFWKDVVPEDKNAIKEVSIGGGKIFVNYLNDASTLVKQFDYLGHLEHDVKFPELGTASGFKGKASAKIIYYQFTSFTQPTTVYKYQISTGKSAIYEKPTVDFNPDDFETRQVFYTSKDGTRVPMFIVFKKGLKLDGKNPTWLYAYGGFNISLTPTFSASRIVWLENGGVYAQPNLRGGGEYGEKWHLAGAKLNKQNVFDDFIAAGDYLVDERYTSHEYLAISGGSNGGLLVGATMTQRPDLAKVALPAVGVMDMLRYNKFTAGAGWAYDYGTAEDSREMFEYLLNYSPLHAIKQGVAYPATLITTADHDDRVVPAHSFKFAATLQEKQVGDNPVMIRIDTKSGHGSSNLSKALDVMADQYAFTWFNMGIVPPLAKKDM